MRLSHYAAAPISFDPARQYTQDDPFGDTIGKPVGLWLSVDGPYDWPSWCSSEGYGIERLVHRHEFELLDPARVLRLSDPGAVEGLAQRFPVIGQRPYSFATISWSAIAREYAGIIIAPYQRPCRMAEATRWYYGWDCASGCVWDASVLRLVSTEAFDVSAHVARYAAVEDAQ